MSVAGGRSLGTSGNCGIVNKASPLSGAVAAPGMLAVTTRTSEASSLGSSWGARKPCHCIGCASGGAGARRGKNINTKVGVDSCLQKKEIQ